MSKEIYEYRGVTDLVCAEVLKDNNETGEGYVTGEVFDIAGVAEIGRTTENSSETHYYDNQPAIVISSTGADTVTCSVSAIPLDVLAKITGQKYDAEKGVFIEGQRTSKYFALGYKTQNTKNEQIYVWRYKGTFSIPDQTNVTQKEGTEANGQEIVFTGISTTHKWNNVKDDYGNSIGCKAINVEVAKNLVNTDTFFDVVTTPDMLKEAEPPASPASPAKYDLITDEGNNTLISVTRGGVELAAGANVLTDGDVLEIDAITSVEGSVWQSPAILRVNNVEIPVDDRPHTMTVTGDVYITSEEDTSQTD